MSFIRRLWAPSPRPTSPGTILGRIDSDISAMISRGRFMGERLQVGPNWVHAWVGHPDGSAEDLGWSRNTITTVGMDWLHDAMFGRAGLGVIGSIATGSGATSITCAALTFTSLAHVGQVVVCENSTDAPVFGNIGTNSATVLTVDSWKYGGGTAGATPGSTCNFLILPGMGPAKYIGLSSDTAATVVGDTVLPSEYITVGLDRAIAAYAHTPAATTSALTKTWTASGAGGVVHKAGLFTCGGPPATCPGVLVANTDLNTPATLAASDTLALTWTWTLPAAA